jgi:hypothetical protein
MATLMVETDHDGDGGQMMLTSTVDPATCTVTFDFPSADAGACGGPLGSATANLATGSAFALTCSNGSDDGSCTTGALTCTSARGTWDGGSGGGNNGSSGPDASTGDATLSDASFADATLMDGSVTGSGQDGSSAGVCVTPPQGLVGWWPGQGNPNDITGGDNGTFPGTYAPGEVGQAFSIDQDDYVTIPDEPALDTGYVSVEAWLRHDVATATYDPVVKKAPAAGGAAGFSLEFDGSGTNLLFWVATVVDGWQSTPGPSVPIGTWTHAVGTYDGATISLYVNGQLAGTTTATGPVLDSVGPMMIGRDPSNASSRSFVGLIDAVSIYDRALTATEVQSLYAAGSAGQCTSQAAVEGGLASCGWVAMAVGDCSGNDNPSIGYTTANDAPVTADCTPASLGLAAVCWDQVNYQNSGVPGGAPGCTYKTNSEASCTGGTHPGFVYACACGGAEPGDGSTVEPGDASVVEPGDALAL